ncbi:Hypothetical predicted protein [Lecanosticta acicola]|uniref:RING-type domain-containing protein n=1 Tax=Lecanosticta acicola TaxID=111012 RepID=A0AAI8Z665_9PEZI|nr:Hypothetical predicted protein [Lecanosticta acicola]
MPYLRPSTTDRRSASNLGITASVNELLAADKIEKTQKAHQRRARRYREELKESLARQALYEEEDIGEEIVVAPRRPAAVPVAGHGDAARASRNTEGPRGHNENDNEEQALGQWGGHETQAGIEAANAGIARIHAGQLAASHADEEVVSHTEEGAVSYLDEGTVDECLLCGNALPAATSQEATPFRPCNHLVLCKPCMIEYLANRHQPVKKCWRW